MFKISLLFSFFLLAVINSYSQDLSNKGKDFWLAYPGHIDATTSRMALYISSDQNTTGVVELAGTTIPFSVTANQATVVQIYPTTYSVYNSQSDGVNAAKGIHITSGSPIVVYAHVLNAARSGSTLLLPTNTLGREYTCVAYTQVSNNPKTAKSQFTIVGVEDNTTVEITPSAASVNNTRLAGVRFSIVLNKGDVYQFQSYSDITGSKIKSVSTGSGCNPLAVFSGSTWNYFNCANGSTGDNLFVQLFPLSAWGKNYVTAPMATRQYDIFRVMVQDPTTIVTLNGTALNTASLVNGTYYEFNSSSANIITSNKPVLVIQYMTSGACTAGANTGDPEIVILNPVEQTLNSVTVLSAKRDLTPPNTNITVHYLNIITTSIAASSIRVDGAPPFAQAQNIAGTKYVYFQENVTNSTNSNPTHTITGDSGFIAMAYGMGNVESYGYNAGTNVKDLYQYVTLQNEYATTSFPATCKNTPFKFSITLPYQPTSLNWDFNSNPNLAPNNIVTDNKPVADSTFFKDGKALFVYTLKTTYVFNATGIYPVKVIANNPTPDGCSGIQEINYDVNVFDPPAVNFDMVTSGCITDSVRFTDLTNGNMRPVIKWIWNFGDQTIDSVKNPAKKFTAPGTYNVKLRSITDVGCIADTTKVITISPNPIAVFKVDGFYCHNNKLVVSDLSTIEPGGTIVKWLWNFGNGSVIEATNNNAQTILYSDTGRYTITLQVETNSGCMSSIFSKEIIIHPNPIANFIMPEVCLSDAKANFKDSSYIINSNLNNSVYSWNFGDGNAVAGNPNTSSQPNPSHKYTAAGYYDVSLTLTSIDGCTGFLSKQFTVNGSVPKSDYTVLNSSSLCSNTEVQIKNNSSVDFGAVTQIEIVWDAINNPGNVIIDSFPSTGKLYSHIYPPLQITKNYQVKFRAYSGITCVNETSQTLTVNASPSVSFSNIPGICFDADPRQITQAGGGIVNGTGVFSGKGISASGTFTPSLAGAGTHSLHYVYSSAMGCKDSLDQTITVWPSPEARWAYSSPTCLNNAITFTDNSVANFSNIAMREWVFGDGTNRTYLTPAAFQKAYSMEGSFDATLLVSTDSGCRSLPATYTIPVHPLPKVDFLLPSVCLPLQARFTNLSSLPGAMQNQLTYLWNFGDPGNAATSSQKDGTHTYTGTGPFKVSLVVSTADGCIDSVSRSLATIYPQPKADFSFAPPDSCLGATFSFKDLSNGVTSNITSWNWNLGDGSNATIQHPARKYVQAGTFNVSLYIKNEQGCISDTATKKLVVYPYPVVNAGSDLFVLEGGNTVINASATGTGLVYNWTPATDLNNPAILKPIGNPSNDITYRLTVNGAGGCSNFDEVFIKVLKSPTIPTAFSPNGDGINDTWIIKYLDSYPGSIVQIFNRYGQPVFWDKGYSKPWNGTSNGSPLPVGVYYYIVSPGNGRKPYSGSVTLIR